MREDDLLGLEFWRKQRAMGVRGTVTGSKGGKGGGTDWSSYWATLISATVENAAPTHVVLTFAAANPSVTDADFTIAGFTIASGSWTGAVFTLVLSTAVIQYNGNLTITFVKTGETGTVTNNVSDSTTVAWYVAGDGSTTYVTKDDSDFVSVWKDLSGNNRPLNQATGTNQPLWESDGILFDGVDNYVKAAAFTNNQPICIYLVGKQITWTVNEYILDGNTTATVALYQKTSTPTIGLFAGVQMENTNFVLNTFAIIRVLVNGANSTFQVNNTDLVSGNAGSNNAAGLTVGSSGSGISWANIKIKEIILRNNVDDAAEQTAIYNYLANKYGFATI